MATAPSAQTHVAPVQIAVQKRNGSLIRKLAELSEEQGQNEVTVTCVQTLGYSMNVGGRQRTDIKLIWGPAGGHSTDEDTFVIVDTLMYDFKLNDNTATSLLEKRRGPSSFPCFPAKGKDGTSPPMTEVLQIF